MSSTMRGVCWVVMAAAICSLVGVYEYGAPRRALVARASSFEGSFRAVEENLKSLQRAGNFEEAAELLRRLGEELAQLGLVQRPSWDENNSGEASVFAVSTAVKHASAIAAEAVSRREDLVAKQQLIKALFHALPANNLATTWAEHRAYEEMGERLRQEYDANATINSFFTHGAVFALVGGLFIYGTWPEQEGSKV